MLLYISNSKTVEDLQDRFSKCFPYLKLEFYKDADAYSLNCDKSNRIKPDTYIGDIRKKTNSGILDIKSWDKTSKVKQDLKEVFGLNVQMFRMHKDEWIPTSYSNDLTLKQQTDLARDYQTEGCT